jgi:hypothetical protein
LALLFPVMAYFIYGLMNVYSDKFKYTLYFILPLSLLSIALKVLWSGGFFSPFFIWIFLLLFNSFLIYQSTFFISFSILNVLATFAAIIYYIQLNQLNFAHVLFNISGFNHFILYCLPYLILAIYYKILVDGKRKTNLLLNLVNSSLELTRENIMNFFKFYRVNVIEIQQLGEKKYKVLLSDEVDKFEKVLELIDFKITHYQVSKEIKEYVIEK